MSRSLVQRSPTECGVSECDREASIMRRLWPSSHEKKKHCQGLLIYPTCVEYLVITYAKFSFVAFLYEVEKGLCADHVHPSVSPALTR